MKPPFFYFTSPFVLSMTSFGVLISSLLFTACTNGSEAPSSRLATVSIEELEAAGYDRLQFALTPLTQGLNGIDTKFFDKGQGLISEQVPVGTYRVTLSYLNGEEVIYSADFCSGEIRNNEAVTLVAGDNQVIINICNSNEEPIHANVSIIPRLQGTGQDEIYGRTVDRSSSWYVDGRDIYFSGNKVSLKGINWFGFDTDIVSLHGLWEGRSVDSYLTQVKDMGFNALRIPLSPQALKTNFPGRDGYATTREALLDLLNEAERTGFYVLLGMHNCDRESGHYPGSPDECPNYSLDDWYADLKTIASIAKDFPNVVGIDPFNEPHSLTWDVWRGLVDNASKVILEENPRLLIFVEGVAGASPYGAFAPFWGANLHEAKTKPLSVPRSRLVFSPHTYGPSVHAEHSYFSAADFPNNMPTIWDQHFGYLADEYPIAIGEFGGFYVGEDKKWQDAFVKYLLDRDIKHFFYWSLNPNSADTGGILNDDWRSINDDKLRLLEPLLR